MQSSYHIIIADDEDDMRSLMARVVVRTYPSVTISAVQDGVDALMVYGQRGADMLITNYDMPLMDGLALVRALRARQVTIPIVMVSGDAGIAQQALAAGITQFVVKPFTIVQFAQILTNLLAP